MKLIQFWVKHRSKKFHLAPLISRYYSDTGDWSKNNPTVTFNYEYSGIYEGIPERDQGLVKKKSRRDLIIL
jgi:hypothetical protein